MSAKAIPDAPVERPPLTTAPVPTEAIPPASASVGAPDAVLALIERAARDPAISVERMQQLFALKKNIDADYAERAFNAAMAAAKAEIGPIFKTKVVDFVSKRTGERTHYRYETLDGVAAVIDPVFGRHGLSYRFRATQTPGGQNTSGKVKVACILTHEAGHSEENSLEASEDHSGSKNPIQAIASTATYLQRQTLKLACGLAAADVDDDGRGAGEGEPPFAMGADEIVYIETLLRDTDSDSAKFLETIGAETIGDFTAEQYKRAIALLNEKKRRAHGTTKQ
jgi:hypothetical protein